MQQVNYGVNRVNNDGLAFKSLQKIPKKAYKVGGQALKDSEAFISELADKNKQDIYVIPKKGLISKIRSLIFFITDEGKQTGRWFSLSTDPKKLMPHSDTSVNGYKTVEKFTSKNIQEAATRASEKQMAKKGFETDQNTVSTPADAIYIAKLIHRA